MQEKALSELPASAQRQVLQKELRGQRSPPRSSITQGVLALTIGEDARSGQHTQTDSVTDRLVCLIFFQGPTPLS